MSSSSTREEEKPFAKSPMRSSIRSPSRGRTESGQREDKNFEVTHDQIESIGRDVGRSIYQYTGPNYIINEPLEWIAYKRQTGMNMLQPLECIDVIRHNFFHLLDEVCAGNIPIDAIVVINTAQMAKILIDGLLSGQYTLDSEQYLPYQKCIWNILISQTIARIGKNQAFDGKHVELFRYLVELNVTDRNVFSNYMFAEAVEHNALYVVRYILREFVQHRVRHPDDTTISLALLCDRIEGYWISADVVNEILAISQPGTPEDEAVIIVLLRKFVLANRTDLLPMIDIDAYPSLRQIKDKVANTMTKQTYATAELYEAARRLNAQRFAELAESVAVGGDMDPSRYRKLRSEHVNSILYHFKERRSGFLLQLVDALDSEILVKNYMIGASTLHDYDFLHQLTMLKQRIEERLRKILLRIGHRTHQT